MVFVPIKQSLVGGGGACMASLLKSSSEGRGWAGIIELLLRMIRIELLLRTSIGNKYKHRSRVLTFFSAPPARLPSHTHPGTVAAKREVAKGELRIRSLPGEADLWGLIRKQQFSWSLSPHSSAWLHLGKRHLPSPVPLLAGVPVEYFEFTESLIKAPSAFIESS